MTSSDEVQVLTKLGLSPLGLDVIFHIRPLLPSRYRLVATRPLSLTRSRSRARYPQIALALARSEYVSFKAS